MSMVFGYGSLLSEYSLRQTCPNAQNLQPARIRGYRREFSLWDAEGLTDESHGDLRYQPYCAVNIVADESATVNGVVFEVPSGHGEVDPADELTALSERENKYQLLPVDCELIDGGRAEALVSISSIRDGEFDSTYAPTLRYLDICLQGASAFGDAFLAEFMATTFTHDGIPLSALDLGVYSYAR